MRRPLKQDIDWTRYEACIKAAISVGCDPDQARDVALATLEEMAEKEEPSPLSYARRRARWRGNDKLRESNREVKASTGYDINNVPGDEPTPEQLFALRQEIEALPSRDRLVLEAFALGLSDTLVAALLDVGVGSVRVLRTRAVKLLRDSME